MGRWQRPLDLAKASWHTPRADRELPALPGPIETFERSGTLLRRTWGENLVARAGLGIVALLPGRSGRGGR